MRIHRSFMNFSKMIHTGDRILGMFLMNLKIVGIRHS